MKILIVDDDRAMSRVTSLSLTKEGGHEVLCADGGAEGLSLALSARPDIIILDVVMPDMGGYEVCRRLKEQEKTRSIPVIFLTAETTTEIIKETAALGALGCINKPFVPASLPAEISRLIDRPRR